MRLSLATLLVIATLAPAMRAVAQESTHCALAIGFEPDPELPSELPLGFYRLLTSDSQRAGFPAFGHVRASDAQCAEGGWSLEFALAGSAMSVVTDPTLVPAQPGEVFDASVLVLPQRLERSTARLVLRALDARGAPIVGSEWVAESDRERGWRRAALRSGAMPEATRSLEVALEVRSLDAGDPTGDVAGSVSFDALEVWRVPNLRVEVDRGGEPIGAAPKRLVVSLVDPAGGARTSGRVLDSDRAEILGWGPTGDADFAVDVPPLPPGAYELEIEVRSGDRLLDRVSRAIAVGAASAIRADAFSATHETPFNRDATSLASSAAREALVRFGLWMDRPAPEARDRIMQIVRLVRPAFVVIDVGDPTADLAGTMSLAEVRRFVDDLRLESIEPVMRLSRLPAAEAARLHLEANDPAAIFNGESEAWRSVFGPWLEHFGHVVAGWMIEGSDTTGAMQAIASEGLVPGFVHMRDQMVVIDSTPDGFRTSADAAARGAIDQWRAGARMIALRGAVDQEPGAAALAFGTLAAAASGAQSIADLEAGSGIGCLLLSCDQSARVLVWRHDGGAPRVISLPFDGSAMHATDALGAVVALERRQGAISAEIGSSPVVIDGVDPVLGAFLAALRFEPSTLEGSTAEQPLTLRLSNPWDVTLEGTFRLVAPIDWSFVPRMRRFSIQPGGTAVLPVQLTLPRTQRTGLARVGVELEFTADRGHVLRVDPPVAIEVRDFTCDATLRTVQLADGRPGAVIELLLTNHSTRALELESTVATTSGLAKRDGPIRIEPGARARRLVRLDEPAGGAVMVTVSQTNGPLRLVRMLP